MRAPKNNCKQIKLSWGEEILETRILGLEDFLFTRGKFTIANTVDPYLLIHYLNQRYYQPTENNG
jgi:hypothetical protein